MELESIDQTAEDVKAEKNQSQPSGHSQELEELGCEEFEGLTDVQLAAVVGGAYRVMAASPCCSKSPDDFIV